MVNKSEYQKSVHAFAAAQEAVLGRLQRSQYVIMKNHVQFLRAAVGLVAFQLDPAAGRVELEKEVLYQIEYEMNRITDLLSDISVEDDKDPNNPLKAWQEDENPACLALKTIKIIILLSKLRVDVGNAVTRLLTLANDHGLMSPKINLQGTRDVRSTVVDENTLDQLLNGLQKTADAIGYRENDIDLRVRIEGATETDAKRITPIFYNINQLIQRNIDYLYNQDEIIKMMVDLEKICKSKKVAKLMTSGGLKSQSQYLELIDEALLRLLYTQNVPQDQFQLNYRNPRAEDILGTGSMGNVTLGQLYGTDTAFKILNMNTIKSALSSEARNELISEMRYGWKKFNHPNITRFYGTFVIGDILFLMFETMEMSLKDLLHTSKYEMKPGEIGDIGVSIMRGLKYLHQNGVVHSTLHPGNVLLNNVVKAGNLDASGLVVKLADFGTRILKKELARGSTENVAYDAPEVIASKKYSFASDVYSFGIVLWEMGQTDARPFAGTKDIAATVVQQKVRPPLQNGCLQDWMKGLAAKCWQSDPWARPLTAEVLKSLEHSIAAEQVLPQLTMPRDQVDISTNARSRESVQNVVNSLAMPTGDSARRASSRLSGIRKSTTRRSNRTSLNARTSIMLTKQKFLFLDEVEKTSHISIGVKIIKTMKFFLHDAEVQLRGIGAIRQLATKEGNEDKLMKMGAGQAILVAMKAHKIDPAIQEHGCGAICNLCFSSESGKALMRCGAGAVIMEALKTHVEDEFVVEEGLQALTNLHSGDSERQMVFIGMDAAKDVVQCLKSMPNAARVQEEAFAAIAYLQTGFPYYKQKVASKKTKKGKKSKDKIDDFFDMKAHMEIIESMKTLSGEAGVQIEGCVALKALCLSEGGRKKDMLKYGILETVQKAMKNFAEDPAVQEATCSLLSGLASLKESNQDLLKLQFDVFILNAMIRHRAEDDESLQLRAVLAIHNWCYNNKKASNKFKKDGAVRVMAQAVKLYPDNKVLADTAKKAAKLVTKGGKA